MVRSPVLILSRFSGITCVFLALAMAGGGSVGCKDDPGRAPGPAAPAVAAPDAVSPAARAAVDALRFDAPESVKAVVAVADEARPLLRTQLAEGDPAAVKHALAAYGASHGRLPPDDLRLALERDDVAVQRLAIEAAGEIGAGELFGALHDRLDDAKLQVRQAAIEALPSIQDPRVQETLLPLVEKTTGRDAVLGDTAATALARAHGPAAPLVALLEHSDPTVRRRGLDILAGRGIPGTLEAVAALTADPVPSVRQQALRTLARFGSGAALARIRPLAASADIEERRLAVQLLEHFDPSDVRAVVWSALDDPDPEVRRIATAQLSRYDGNRDLLVALPKKIADEAAPVRSAAVLVAQGLRRTPMVEEMLLDRIPLETDPKVFRVLGAAFRTRGMSDAAFPKLVAALGEARGIAADGIGEALHALTGQPFGTDAWAWRDWAARQSENSPDAGGTGAPGAADAGPAAP